MIKNEIVQKVVSYIYESVRFDIRSKSIFLLISIVLWFSITLEKDYETTLTIPIRYSGLSKSKTFKEPTVDSATLKVRGRGRTLFSNEGELFFQIDLSNFDDSTRVYLNPENFVNFSDRDITFIGSVDPVFIDIKLDSLKLKRVKVVPNIKLETDIGYTVSKKGDFYPKEVILKGPATIINNIDNISTYPVEFNNIVSDIDATLKLNIPHSDVVKSSSSKINYNSSIVRIGSYTFKHLVDVVNKPKGKLLSLEPISVELKVVGAVDKLHQLSEDNFNVTIDYNMIDKSSKKAPINITTDTELEWSSNIKKVKVTEF
ncbi:MAG: hypothetical protein CR982_04455 [Candidatus Cloacimonadota bacterium]|nr:MAG: hypothetical protein CR982_04455 [Candidatus Cloacimonadota bacterium]PIE79484.1 MAG: hypothetical protein CSA15_03005 [Candidatus Delongbacteria bacterium]